MMMPGGRTAPARWMNRTVNEQPDLQTRPNFPEHLARGQFRKSR
ncbi:hypothetical protein X907_2159 [Glycocaulis alkaliphilus]|uniref:Uncharacterized protein n=1 Tax=Glycocaulis alkaliphilus TaxID=1434191 RepID=A0A3T0EBL4_9PROT|nr:hypothetical protein X907_2159 [Glycocaulis alkaliphilus]